MSEEATTAVIEEPTSTTVETAPVEETKPQAEETVTNAPVEDSAPPVESKKPAEPDTTAAPAATDDIDDALISLAEGYGLDADQTKAFTSAGALRTALSALDRRALQMVQKMRESAPKAPEPKEEAPQVAEKPATKTRAEIDFGDMLDEDVADAIKKVIGDLHSEIDALKAEKAGADTKSQAETLSQQEHQQEVMRWNATDQLIAMARKMAPEWSEVFGEQSLNEMTSATPFDNAWRTFKETAQGLVEAAESGFGAPIPKTPEQFVERVLYSAFLDKAKDIHNTTIANLAKKQAKTHTRPPTTRADLSPPRDKEQRKVAAIEAVSGLMREAGIDPRTGPTTVDEIKRAASARGSNKK